MRIELTTPRLVLRPIAGDDARMLHELWTNAGVRRFLWDDEIIPMARTEAVVEQSERLSGRSSHPKDPFGEVVGAAARLGQHGRTGQVAPP